MTADERNTLEVLRAEVNGKLDLLVERTAHLQKEADDFEGRVRALEKWRYGIPVTALAALAAAAVSLFK